MSTVIYSEVYTCLVQSILEHYYLFHPNNPRKKMNPWTVMYMFHNSEYRKAQYDLFFSLMESIGKITKFVIKYGVNFILLIMWYVAVVSPGRCV